MHEEQLGEMTIRQDMAGEAQGTPENQVRHRRLSLRKNFSWVFVGTLIYSFAGWLTILIVAKLGDPTTVGLLVLAQAICVPVLWFSSLNLRILSGIAWNSPGGTATLPILIALAGSVFSDPGLAWRPKRLDPRGGLIVRWLRSGRAGKWPSPGRGTVR